MQGYAQKLMSKRPGMVARCEAIGSAPVTKDVVGWPVETMAMRTLHRDPEGYRMISVGAHLPEGIRAGRTHAGFNFSAAREGKGVDSVEQATE